MSALDARMRLIAREEAGKLTTEATATDAGTDRVAELEKQLAELTARVDELEKPTPAKRSTRKTATETTE